MAVALKPTEDDISYPKYQRKTMKYGIQHELGNYSVIVINNNESYELDKQITDLVSYNTPYNSHAIINDTVDTPLNKEYIGEQR